MSILTELAALDTHAIDWHAERYDSAGALQGLINLAQSAPDYLAERGIMRELVGAIAEACEGDGADKGFIPCLADPHRAVWNRLYGMYR
jgi:hypothetical protein